jgi:hypothetical protein
MCSWPTFRFGWRDSASSPRGRLLRGVPDRTFKPLHRIRDEFDIFQLDRLLGLFHTQKHKRSGAAMEAAPLLRYPRDVESH